MRDNIIEIKTLTVSFNGNTILNLKDRIDINKGDVVGIIGENGAGKSTLVNCIIDKISYTGKIDKNFVNEELGIQFQNNSYNKLMKVFEIIQIVTGERKFDNELMDSIRNFEIDGLLKKRIGKLSGGELQRLTLFLTLYLEPQILIFDELTTGLDYQKRIRLLRIVKKYSEGKTVLTITHYFEELKDWANKLLVLHKGEKIFFNTVEEFEKKYSHYSVLKVKHENIVNQKEDMFENLNIIQNFAEECDGFITKNLEQQQYIINLLSKMGVLYEMVPCSIYTMYSLAINNWKGSEKIEKLSLD